MENLPKHVINKIMFFLTHPVADILKEEAIFHYMAFRLNKPNLEIGEPFFCGCLAAHNPWEYFNPQKFTCIDRRTHYNINLTPKERSEYTLGYLHYRSDFVVLENDSIFRIAWSIRCNKEKSLETAKEYNRLLNIRLEV